MKTLSILTSSLLVLLFLSCQKEITLDELFQESDSTQLIKSISFIPESGNIADSIVETYQYDTVNRKITIIHTPDFNGRIKTELNYLPSGLLFHIEYTYNRALSTGEPVMVDITYDNTNIIQTFTITNEGGGTQMINYHKTSLPNGRFQVSWQEDIFTNGNLTDYFALFDSLGRVIVRAERDFLGGAIIDSLIYDNEGLLEKTYRTDTIFTSPFPPVAPFVQANSWVSSQIHSNYGKSDQLFNQVQLVLNGIARFPLGYMEIDKAGLLSFDYEPYIFQYSRFPTQSATLLRVISNNDVYYEDLQPYAEFDNLNRLVRYGGLNNYGSDPFGFRITYYK